MEVERGKIKMNNVFPILDKINAVYGTIVAVLAYCLGAHWMLFVAFLFLNIVDYITGCLKAKINQKENSVKGSLGALKKLGYWLMIMVAYGMSGIFVEVGKELNIDLSFTSFIGLFVLASLILNELRSIIENFVEAGYEVPAVLIRGLEVANKAIDGVIRIDKDHNTIETDLSMDDVQGKNQITLQVKESGKI